MVILPIEARPAAFHHWLVAQLHRDEPLWHAAFGFRLATVSAAKAWGALKALGREVRDRGIVRTLAETATVVALDGLADNPNGSAADVVWRDAAGQNPLALEAAALGLTPHRLIVLGIGKLSREGFADDAWAPSWCASFTPEQTAGSVRMRTRRIVKNVHVVLELGQGEHEETFVFEEGFCPGNLAQAQAIEARLAPR